MCSGERRTGDLVSGGDAMLKGRNAAKHSFFFPLFFLLVLLPGCSSFLPSSGPSSSDIVSKKPLPALEIVNVDENVTRSLLARVHRPTLQPLMGACNNGGQRIGPGDVLSITIWETPPATLFNISTAQSMSSSSGIQTNTGPTSLPDQQVNHDGTISVPFAGTIRVTGLTLPQIGKEIYDRLKGKTHDPQVLVRLSSNVSSTVTVVGEVNQSKVVPLTPKCERLLDVLAEAGGVKQQTNKLMVQLTRANAVYTVALDDMIRDNRENIYAEPGDVVTVLYQPLSFTALGATEKNAEIEFEATGITLAQALARVGGLVNTQADVAGVFLFRYEPRDALDWPTPPTLVTPDGRVPVVYRLDLRRPETLFASRSFPIQDKDILYVSTAPAVQLGKFLQILGSLTSPGLGTASSVKNLTRPY